MICGNIVVIIFEKKIKKNIKIFSDDVKCHVGITSTCRERGRSVRDHKWSKTVSALVITEAVGILCVVFLYLLLYKWLKHTEKTQWEDLAADEIMNERMCKLTNWSEFTWCAQRETKMKIEGKIYRANSKKLTAFDQKEEQM